jgi:RNA polymerase sigma-70 factor (ECF subfamily)
MFDNLISNLSDSELIARAKTGDATAFGELHVRHAELIYRYVLARVNIEGDAEDLTEVVFQRAFERLNRYRERGRSFSAFLYQVARNELDDHNQQQCVSESSEAVGRLPSSNSTPGDRLMEGERTVLVRETLSGLPMDYQEVIRLSIMLSLPTATVGEWLGRSEGAVRVLLHRALEALQRRMVGTDA